MTEQLVKFKKLAGVEMRWRYTKKYPYGEGRRGTRSIMPSFRDKMVRALVDLWVLSGLGPADRIVSAGAWVPEGTNGRGPDDRHVQGIAIDIDAIHWEGESLIAHPERTDLGFYMGTEAHFRRYFHTVLGWSYNDDHRGHWHIDDGVALRGYDKNSQMHKRFLQAVLKYVWYKDGNPYYEGRIDGDIGTKSLKAIAKLERQHHLEPGITSGSFPTWSVFLLLTAIQGMRVQ
jgi:hypothetical protein